MFKQIIIRIKYNTLIRIQKIFPPCKDESAARYFDRLAIWLERNKLIIPI